MGSCVILIWATMEVNAVKLPHLEIRGTGNRHSVGIQSCHIIEHWPVSLLGYQVRSISDWGKALHLRQETTATETTHTEYTD